MNRPNGTTPPSAKTMSSKMTPWSGSVIETACCMAREVRPIFRARMVRPSASLAATSARCTR